MNPNPTNHPVNEPPQSFDMPAWQQLLTGQALAVRHQLSTDPGSNSHLPPAQIIHAQPLHPVSHALLPGSFNPLHAGHQQMQQLASEILEREVHFELAVANVDKPSLTADDMAQRLRAAQDSVAGRPMHWWFTRAATFVEKSRLFPGAVFVVGADTAARLADLRYYQGDEHQRDQAIGQLADRNCRFLVFGRALHSQFIELHQLDLPRPLKQLCQGVPASAFRADISSTSLRQQSGERL